MQGTSAGARRSKMSKVLAQKPPGNDGIGTSSPGVRTTETSISSKLTTQNSSTNRPFNNDSHDPGSTETSTNNPHIPHTKEPLWHAIIQRKDNKELFTKDNIHSISHNNGIAILNRYFPKSPIGQSYTSNALVLDTLRGSDNEIAHRNIPKATAYPTTPELLSTPQSSNAVLKTTSLIKEIIAVPDTCQIKPLRVNNNALTAATYSRIAKRTTLNESGYRLDDVIKALAVATNTSRIPDFIIPGISEYLAQNKSMEYSKIITSITTNCVKYSRNLSKPALDAKKERLQEYKRNTLEHIAKDRQQMNITLPARLTSELNHQQYADRLKKATQHAIMRLDLKELAKIELKDTISKPSELTGEFKDESNYKKVIKQLEKDRANSTKTQQRSLWKETYYWPMIQQRAKMVGQLPNPSGPKTDITPQEKIAAKRLILTLRYGTSRDNIFKWTSY